MESPFANKTRQEARTINGIHTEVLVSEFQDRMFVVVTQYGKIGSLVREKSFGKAQI